MPDILFRMPIKDNVTCKICKLLPSLWHPEPPPPAPTPQVHSLALRPRALPWSSLRVQAFRALGTLRLGETAAPNHCGPPRWGHFLHFLLSSPPPRPFPGPSGQQSCCCQARGRACARTGALRSCSLSLSLPGESPRGSVLTNLNPGSLFAAPGDSRTGGRHCLWPGSTERWEAEVLVPASPLAGCLKLSVLRSLRSQFLHLENRHKNRVPCESAGR